MKTFQTSTLTLIIYRTRKIAKKISQKGQISSKIYSIFKKIRAIS